MKTEHQEQMVLLDWFNLAYPLLRRFLFAIPNGAWLAGNARQRAALVTKMKKEGMKSGVPDLMLAYPCNGYCGLFVEMKREKGGKTSKQQSWYVENLAKVGYKTAVCAGADEAMATVKEYLSVAQ